MRRRDWAAILLLILLVATDLLGRIGDDRRPMPDQPAGPALERPKPRQGAGPLPGEGEVIVEPSRPGGGFTSGTGFAVADGKRLLTAWHVVNDCQSILVGQPGTAAFQAVRLLARHPSADLALLEAAEPRPAFALAARPATAGIAGYHFGYPAGRPGAAESQLLGEATLRFGGSRQTREPVLVWAQRRHEPAGLTALSGASGGPTLTASGAVVGVTVAEAVRRGRIYSAAPESIAALLGTAGLPAGPGTGKAVITDENWLDAERQLRTTGRVVKIVCSRDRDFPPGTRIQLKP